MRVAVMAAGAVGGYIGPKMANAGHDVTLFARGAHLDAIRKNGLRVESPLGDLHVTNAHATDDPASVKPVDAIVFAVKLWDLEKAAESLKPIVTDNTRVITVQNGIDSVERLEPILGRGRVVPGLAQIAIVIAAPGVIKHSSQFARFRCGHLDGHDDAKLQAFVDAAVAAGIDFSISKQIELELWQKFILLTGMSSITAATRSSIGPLREDADVKAFLHDLLREATAVGRARGIALPPETPDSILGHIEKTLPPGMKASMAHDLERGNRLELDWLAGKVVALGRELNVPTPACRAVYALLKTHRLGHQAA